MFQHAVVVFTGGVQGIGKGIALAYAKSGVSVVVAEINAEMGKQFE